MRSKTTGAKFETLLQLEKAKIMFRKSRTSVSGKKCEVCPEPVGIVSLGQEKRFCSSKCRARRHRHSR